MAALTVTRIVVLLTNSAGKRIPSTRDASNPFFFLLLFTRTGSSPHLAGLPSLLRYRICLDDIGNLKLIARNREKHFHTTKIMKNKRVSETYKNFISSFIFPNTNSHDS